jgi:DNA-binding CsgD family transcriptional regulator
VQTRSPLFLFYNKSQAIYIYKEVIVRQVLFFFSINLRRTFSQCLGVYPMGSINQPIRLASIVFIVIGGILFLLNIFVEGIPNLALPLVFLMLGGAFYILVIVGKGRLPWAPIFYIPGSLVLALGLIFLLNTVTNDWDAWSYAWLLLTSGVGFGLVQANRHFIWPPVVNLVGWGFALGSIMLFAFFGAIVGGMFIRVAAPILLILGGLSLRWLPWAKLFPEHTNRGTRIVDPEPRTITVIDDSIEPLSARELEVLHLVEMGLSNQQIAAKLNIASSTVKTHINNIYSKLGVQTRVQAINKAKEYGLLNS